MSEESYSPSVQAKDPEEWRNWLAENHDRAQKIWLIIYRKDSGVSSVYYSEAVDEALCFGWIDSVRQKRDNESFYVYFTPRNPKSHWSRVNKEKIKKLTQNGKLMPPGVAMVDLAKRTGTWDTLNEVDNMEVPEDLRKAFKANQSALKHWKNFPPSSKRLILFWILSAKREETRKKRIQETVEQASRNIRANHYRQPKNR